MQRLFPPLLCGERVLKIEKVEAAVAELLIVSPDELRLHKLESVGELCGEAFALGLDDDHAVDGAVGFAAEQQEVGDVASGVAPCAAFLLIAVDDELRERLVTVEIGFELTVVDDGKKLLGEEVTLQPAVEAVGQIVIGLRALRVRILLWLNLGDVESSSLISFCGGCWSQSMMSCTSCCGG